MEELSKTNAILIDIDGTICDSHIAMNYLNGIKDENNYEVYYRLLDLCSPIPKIIEDIKSKIISKIGYNEEDEEIIPSTLVFLTGRNAEKHVVEYTLDFIEKYFSDVLRFPEVKADFYFRPINNHVKTTEFKTQKFQMLKTLYNFSHIYEDEVLNIQMFYSNKQEGTIVHWVQSSYNYSLGIVEKQEDLDDVTDIVIHKV